MRYSFVCKENKQSKQIKNELLTLINGTLDEKNPEVVFSIGGDGTVLDAIHKYNLIIEDVLIVAIHTGSLGFYTEFLPNQLMLIKDLLAKKRAYLSYFLLKCTYNGKTNYALNEVTLFDQHRLFTGKIEVNGELLMNYKASGICVATPSGSTAYNKSLGGAIIDNNIKAMQISFIAPFQTLDTNMIGPVVLSSDKKIIIKPNNKQIDITFDHLIERGENVSEVVIKIASKKVKFLKNNNHNYIKRLREKFIMKI